MKENFDFWQAKTNAKWEATGTNYSWLEASFLSSFRLDKEGLRSSLEVAAPQERMNRLLMQVETAGGAGTGKEERESPIQHLLQKQSKMVKEVTTCFRVFQDLPTYIHWSRRLHTTCFSKSVWKLIMEVTPCFSRLSYIKIGKGGYDMFFQNLLENWSWRLQHVFQGFFFAFGVVTLGRGLPAAVALFQLTCKNGSRSFSKKNPFQIFRVPWLLLENTLIKIRQFSIQCPKKFRLLICLFEKVLAPLPSCIIKDNLGRPQIALRL